MEKRNKDMKRETDTESERERYRERKIERERERERERVLCDERVSISDRNISEMTGRHTLHDQLFCVIRHIYIHPP